MTPQSNLMVLAPVAPGRVDELRQVLASMNGLPGTADPNNALIPFAGFETLHFAPLLVLEDKTLDDITKYGLPKVDYPTYFAFLADFDGDRRAFVTELL